MFVDGKIVTKMKNERLIPGPRGVRKIVPEKCFRGFTMYSTAFGDTEYLIDLNGMVVHTWPVTHSQYAELRPNGNLMADNYGSWVEEITPLGERIWIWKGRYHHDFHVVDDDHVAVLIQEPPIDPIPGVHPKEYEPEKMQSHAAQCVNRKGEVQWKFLFKDHIDELHELAGLPLPVRFASMNKDGTIVENVKKNFFHTNTIEVLSDNPAGAKDERFRKGNVLVSFRALDIIAVFDVEKDQFVWAWGLGVLDGQHQPRMTDSGTILIFDNGTARGYSAVVEIDPTTDKEVWRYEDRENFYSAYRAGVNRLPNGNTLVAESDAGRIFELTPEKEIVWDYLNPFLSQKAGSQGLHVYRATRYTDEQVAPIFEARKDEKVGALGNADLESIDTYREAVQFYREGLGG